MQVITITLRKGLRWDSPEFTEAMTEVVSEWRESSKADTAVNPEGFNVANIKYEGRP